MGLHRDSTYFCWKRVPPTWYTYPFENTENIVARFHGLPPNIVIGWTVTYFYRFVIILEQLFPDAYWIFHWCDSLSMQPLYFTHVQIKMAEFICILSKWAVEYGCSCRQWTLGLVCYFSSYANDNNIDMNHWTCRGNNLFTYFSCSMCPGCNII